MLSANGVYELDGVYNDRPCWRLVDADGTVQGVLWYFSSNALVSKSWNGWYISRHVGTSSLSAGQDYYSAYVHGPLPPSEGWVTRPPSILPTGGKGINPAPQVEVLPNADDTFFPRVAATLRKDMSFVPYFPASFVVSNAGAAEVNGVYEFVSVANNRPYYQHQGTGPVLWYFYSFAYSLDPKLSYNGWYISRKIDLSPTCALSAKDDYYTAYNHEKLPPQSEWVTRSPGISPAAGCGIAPPPSFVAGELMLVNLKVQEPRGNVVGVVIGARASVATLKLKLQGLLGLPTYQQTLTCGDHLLTDADTFIDLNLQPGSLIKLQERAFASLLNEFPVVAIPARTVVIVGAGPVGLWVAVQLKFHLPHWSVCCYEKHEVYQRHHALRLSEETFENLMPFAQLELLVRAWTPRSRTSAIESGLSALALSLGVELRRGRYFESIHCIYNSPVRSRARADGQFSNVKRCLIRASHEQPLSSVGGEKNVSKRHFFLAPDRDLYIANSSFLL